MLNIRSKYRYNKERGGFVEIPCNCPNVQKDDGVYQDSNYILFTGVVPTTINGYAVHPNTLVLNLSDQDRAALAKDARFRVIDESQLLTYIARAGK